MKPYTVFAIFLIFTCGCQQQADLTSETALLLRTDREFSEMSATEGAPAAFQAFLLENALQLPALQLPIHGREAIYQDMVSAGGGYTLTWEPQSGEVALSGDMGYTWGIYTITIDSDDPKSRQGKYLNVWKKDLDGNWRVLIDMGNQNPPGEQQK